METTVDNQTSSEQSLEERISQILSRHYDDVQDPTDYQYFESDHFLNQSDADIIQKCMVPSVALISSTDEKEIAKGFYVFSLLSCKTSLHKDMITAMSPKLQTHLRSTCDQLLKCMLMTITSMIKAVPKDNDESLRKTFATVENVPLITNIINDSCVTRPSVCDVACSCAASLIGHQFSNKLIVRRFLSAGIVPAALNALKHLQNDYNYVASVLQLINNLVSNIGNKEAVMEFFLEDKVELPLLLKLLQNKEHVVLALISLTKLACTTDEMRLKILKTNLFVELKQVLASEEDIQVIMLICDLSVLLLSEDSKDETVMQMLKAGYLTDMINIIAGTYPSFTQNTPETLKTRATMINCLWTLTNRKEQALLIQEGFLEVVALLLKSALKSTGNMTETYKAGVRCFLRVLYEFWEIGISLLLKCGVMPTLGRITNLDTDDQDLKQLMREITFELMRKMKSLIPSMYSSSDAIRYESTMAVIYFFDDGKYEYEDTLFEDDRLEILFATLRSDSTKAQDVIDALSFLNKSINDYREEWLFKLEQEKRASETSDQEDESENETSDTEPTPNKKQKLEDTPPEENNNNVNEEMVTFIFEDGSEIKVNKNKLISRSEYFKVMFSSGMIESQNNIVKIADVPYQRFVKMIEILENGRINKDDIEGDDEALEMIKDADRYQIKSVELICSEYLEESIDQNSIFEFLTFTNNYQATMLRNICMKWIANNLKTFCDTDEGMECMKSVSFATQLKEYLRDAQWE